MKSRTAAVIRKLMSEKGLSARQLSKGCGVSASTLSEILNGADPSLKNAKLIASYFNISLDYLVSDQPAPITFHGDDFQEVYSGVVRITIEKFNSATSKKKGG